jgi:hypothetical protein
MSSFFSKYSFLVIWISVIVIVGALFVLVVQPNLHFGSTQPTTPVPASTAPAVVVPPSPSVTLTIEKSATGNKLFVQWENLPGNTTALNIFRGLRNSTSGWSLWKTVTLTADELADGNTLIDLGKTNLAGYSFYVEAVNGNASGTNENDGTGSNPTVLWTSSVTDPAVTTSTPPVAPGTQTSSSTPSSTPPDSTTPPPVPTSTPTSTGQSNNPPPPPPPTPSGTPFYNPQVQIEGYGQAQTNNFWVQHVDQKIQIGWQNLPPTTTSVVILRAQNQDGPWAVVLTQENPGVNGAYSIQVVDDTLGIPYFYEMNAVAGSSTIATYGPVYLPGN